MVNEAMPSFDFSGDFELSLDDVAAEMEKGRKQRFLRPGSYDVKIANVEAGGFCEKDPSFAKFTLTLATVGGTEIKHFLQVPTTNNIKYGESGTFFPFTNVKDLLIAVGADISDMKSAARAIAKYFANGGTKLLDKTLNITASYRGAYINFLSKSDDGVKQLNILTSDGVPHPKFAGTTYGSYDAAQNAADEAGVKLEGFVSITAVSPVAH